MSIKVYSAYKLNKPSEFWKTTAKIKKEAEIQATKAIVDFSEQIDLEKCPKEIKNSYSSNSKFFGEEKAAKLAKCKYIYNCYKEQLSLSEKDLFDLDVSFTIHEYKKNLYLIPYCSGIMSNVFQFLKTADYLKDYSYWDNSDPPDNVAIKEWNRRFKIWDAITENECWSNYAVFEVSTIHNFYSLLSKYL